MRATDDVYEPWLFLEIAVIQAARALPVGLVLGQEQVVEGCQPSRLNIERQKPPSLCKTTRGSCVVWRLQCFFLHSPDTKFSTRERGITRVPSDDTMVRQDYIIKSLHQAYTAGDAASGRTGGMKSDIRVGYLRRVPGCSQLNTIYVDNSEDLVID